MLNTPLASLAAGDVLLIKYNDTYWHTMLVVSNGRLAHAPSPGMPCVVETLAAFAQDARKTHSWSEGQLKAALYGYRYTGTMPYPGWAAFAEQWCQPDSNQVVTHYAASPNDDQKRRPDWKDYPRYRGVVKGTDDGHNAAALPFGTDALMRSIKWAWRHHMRIAFSEHRGTTCCAFVMACIQAAFINASFYHPQQEQLHTLLDLFEKGGEVGVTGSRDRAKTMKLPAMRGPASPQAGKPRADAALRANSNRGLSDDMLKKFSGLLKTDRQGDLSEARRAAAFWDLLQTHGFVNVPWKDVNLPQALTHDAKYMYSRTFNHVLAADNEWRAC
jgi:hypothetical protein